MKIPCFMPNSACGRPIVKNVKIFGNHVKFWITPWLQNAESWWICAYKFSLTAHLDFFTYNAGNTSFEFYKVLVQIWIATSKAELDIWQRKLYLQATSGVVLRLKP